MKTLLTMTMTCGKNEDSRGINSSDCFPSPRERKARKMDRTVWDHESDLLRPLTAEEIAELSDDPG